ncbi:short-chain fatty acyl-CoA regulator family protein [Litoreibacter halocynthiae]|uniref:short-chain fatty acyl-CoA regulator family protein n=1 Tax=Litoreibacter halocynthiae TaxID=1242689 RepID=UPI00248F6606|nr:short-chain fatty acyl-CoA regulator family protein [Litoreibacter halocynthiae]
MPKSALTGSRIREHRLMRGLKQADLARDIGISASYLNLIEHNRRRIGGKTLLALSEALKIDPSTLSQGAERAVVTELQDAAASDADVPVELDQIDDLVARFPGWAAKVTAQHRRLRALEQTVGGLNDRLTHDPVLSERMHEVLSTVSAIRSTAAILVGTPDLGTEWQARFYSNIDTESRRLADSSAAMAAHLDNLSRKDTSTATPLEVVFSAFDARGHHLRELEVGGDPEALAAQMSEIDSTAARTLAAEYFRTYSADAKAMPLEAFEPAAHEMKFDPAALAARFGVPLEAVFRRLASLPRGATVPDIGLVSCDAAGALLVRKSPSGLALPWFGAGCPLWPLYAALSAPGVPIRRVIEGEDGARFTAMALAHPSGPLRFDRPPVYHSIMLLIAQDDTSGEAAIPVGSSCRICARSDCDARREPTVLTHG